MSTKPTDIFHDVRELAQEIEMIACKGKWDGGGLSLENRPLLSIASRLISAAVCGNTPSCGESAVVWTKDGDMQCSECGHPMTVATPSHHPTRGAARAVEKLE